VVKRKSESWKNSRKQSKYAGFPTKKYKNSKFKQTIPSGRDHIEKLIKKKCKKRKILAKIS